MNECSSCTSLPVTLLHCVTAFKCYEGIMCHGFSSLWFYFSFVQCCSSYKCWWHIMHAAVQLQGLPPTPAVFACSCLLCLCVFVLLLLFVWLSGLYPLPWLVGLVLLCFVLLFFVCFCFLLVCFSEALVGQMHADMRSCWISEFDTRSISVFRHCTVWRRVSFRSVCAVLPICTSVAFVSWWCEKSAFCQASSSMLHWLATYVHVTCARACVCSMWHVFMTRSHSWVL